MSNGTTKLSTSSTSSTSSTYAFTSAFTTGYKPLNPNTGDLYNDGVYTHVFDGTKWVNTIINNGITYSYIDGKTREDIMSALEANVFIFNVVNVYNRSDTTSDLYNSYVEYLVSLKFYYLPFCTDIVYTISHDVRLQIVSKMIQFLETVTTEQKDKIKRMYEKIVMVEKLKGE